MEVTKVPPAEPAIVRPVTVAMTEQIARAAADIAPPGDRADIRPLDISAALQILLTEVRAGLDIPAGAAIPQSPTQSARELVEMFLQAVPEDASDAPVWTAAIIHVETTMLSSIERAIGVVVQWRDVAPTVVDAVKETRAFFLSVLSDDPQNPLWLPPEWMALGLAMHRYRRRRRNARRRMTDPDYSPGSLDESEEFRR
jgi:hypothetical protein